MSLLLLRLGNAGSGRECGRSRLGRVPGAALFTLPESPLSC